MVSAIEVTFVDTMLLLLLMLLLTVINSVIRRTKATPVISVPVPAPPAIMLVIVDETFSTA